MPIPFGRHNLKFPICFFQEVSKLSKSRSAYRKFPNVSKYLEKKLVQRRKDMKISQTVLAEKTGLSRNCIQQMECHEHLPLPSTMFKLINALNFSEEEAAEFWAEINAAYSRDEALQEEAKTQNKQNKNKR